MWGQSRRLLSWPPVRRRPLLLLLAAGWILPAIAQGQTPARLDVIDISGPLDNQAVEFVTDTILDVSIRGAEVVVIQLDSPGVVADRAAWDQLVELVSDPPVPIVVWVGPAPAVAYGGALELAMLTQWTVAAPGAVIGYARPTFIAGEHLATSDLPERLLDDVEVVEEPVAGVIDDVSPAIQQLIAAIDGVEVDLAGETRELRGLSEDGQVVFHKPGFWARFLRLAITPEAALMFLVAGLAVAAFEFYAVGPGIAAVVAALSLFLATYGIASLPLRWWAVGLVLAGWWAMTDSYQRGSVATLTGLGAAMMLVGGLWFVDGAPQLQMNPIVVAVVVAVVTAFYAVAMPTVARTRFSTRTIGRDHLIGARGVALVDFDPDGEVEVSGARWRASAHREAGIGRGDEVRIAEVDGLVLEVEPVGAED